VIGHFFEMFVQEIYSTQRRNVLRLVMTVGPRFPELAAFYYRNVVERAISAMRALLARAKERGEIADDRLIRFAQMIMAPALFMDLIGSIRHSFFVLPSAEIAVEIDPRTLTSRMVEALGLGGVNRASLGVQSFDPAVQRAINRVQSFAETADAVASLRRAGLTGINLDLIYGLPLQTVASCLDTVSRCLALRPDRFSVFGYAHVPSFKKHQCKIEESCLPERRHSRLDGGSCRHHDAGGDEPRNARPHRPATHGLARYAGDLCRDRHRRNLPHLCSAGARPRFCSAAHCSV